MAKFITSLIQRFALVALVFAAPAALAQGMAHPWYKISTSTYVGGSVRMDFPFEVEVESKDIAVVVPAYCAPRALASRATIWDSFSNWTRSVHLKFLRQDLSGGMIRAFYRPVIPFDNEIATITGVQFSFTQVGRGHQTRCRIDVYAQ